MPVIFLYCHNGQSYGHLKKLANLAKGFKVISPGVKLLCISSSPYGPSILPRDVDYVKLPSYRMIDSTEGLFSEPVTPILYDDFIAMRSEMILRLVSGYRPDALIIDDEPWGKSGELIEAIVRYPEMSCFLLLNGVIDEKARSRRRLFNSRFFQFTGTYFSKVFVNCDRRIFDIIQYYELPSECEVLFQHTGYIVDPEFLRTKLEVSQSQSRAEVLVQVGGGGGAEELLKIILLAAGQSRKLANVKFVILTGQYVDETGMSALRGLVGDSENLELIPFSSEMGVLYDRAQYVVGAGGYNTLVEILFKQKSSLIIPRQLFEKEQSIHAALLQRKGLLHSVLPLPSISLQGVEQAIASGLRSKWAPADSDIDFAGVPHIVEEVLKKCR